MSNSNASCSNTIIVFSSLLCLHWHIFNNIIQIVCRFFNSLFRWYRGVVYTRAEIVLWLADLICQIMRYSVLCINVQGLYKRDCNTYCNSLGDRTCVHTRMHDL
ncbi:hypothetical protein EV426DRAFT_618097 [Tirmania nivea]|nr:hypothetical protein EV426DRAFT_618097 [Tirmania nivea]